ncbi:hypothetical protein RvY_03258 [Ramazzottius varieornatus]|uniref:Uncharacterized protein n=1 Tax=Ramazzottius varieornatus TaxID=947166 RepID=A0A1D1UMH0_RAMVA|nr:hypothetical protein RvY_03258 [Ramazzottius varieornatus]
MSENHKRQKKLTKLSALNYRKNRYYVGQFRNTCCINIIPINAAAQRRKKRREVVTTDTPNVSTEKHISTMLAILNIAGAMKLI